MKLGKPKGKQLGGAPRAGKWTTPSEPKRLGGKHRGSFILLAVLGVMLLAGMGVFAVMAQRRLDEGLLVQYRQSLRRPDWVRLNQLPRHVVDAFVTVVDTSGFQRTSEFDDRDRPLLTRDLVAQVHRLNGSMADQAWRTAMVPLVEARLSRRASLEFYLNRISMGRTGDWPVYGVRHAAEDYFGKDPRALTLGEAATLAGILLPPRLSNPDAAPAAVGARRNEVLRRMLQARRIDEAAFRAAMAEPLGFQPGVDYAPMTRPVDWGREPEPIVLPPELRPTLADTARESEG